MSFVKCGTLELSYQCKTRERLFHRILIGKCDFAARIKHPTAYFLWNNGVTDSARCSNGEESEISDQRRCFKLKLSDKGNTGGAPLSCSLPVKLKF